MDAIAAALSAVVVALVGLFGRRDTNKRQIDEIERLTDLIDRISKDDYPFLVKELESARAQRALDLSDVTAPVWTLALTLAIVGGGGLIVSYPLQAAGLPGGVFDSMRTIAAVLLVISALLYAIVFVIALVVWRRKRSTGSA